MKRPRETRKTSLFCCADLERAKDGFVYPHVKSIDMFLDGSGSKAADAVHIVFAGEKVRPEYPTPAPDVEEASVSGTSRVLSLPALVRMKLTSFGPKKIRCTFRI